MYIKRKYLLLILIIPAIISLMLGIRLGAAAVPVSRVGPSPTLETPFEPGALQSNSTTAMQAPTHTATPTLPLRPTTEATPEGNPAGKSSAIQPASTNGPSDDDKTADLANNEIEAFSPIDHRAGRIESANEDKANAAAQFMEPAGCAAPPEDYLRMWVDGQAVSRRTYAMLETAAEMFAGPYGLFDLIILQGSYDRADPGGMGIYTGGGVVDLAVVGPGTRGVERIRVDHLVRSLRAAGFAAWYREAGALYEGSPPHVHAVAIGDRRLSEAAAAELTGSNGYFRGYSGLPDPNGAPQTDPHGPPVLCSWMREIGYADLRQEDFPVSRMTTAPGWEERLRLAAEAYITTSMEESNAIAQQIDFLENESESAANMCGPLAASILKDAGLMPQNGAAATGPGQDPASYWLANPRLTDRPWRYFPSEDYTLTRVREPASHYDFSADPLRPGDLLYTYAVNNGFDHMFVVTEVDSGGRAYTVTNNRQQDGSYLIERLMLYDPQDSTAGVFRDDWALHPEIGQTGLGGFDRLRRNGVTLPEGSRFIAQAAPGDTLYTLAARHNSRVSDIITLNHGIDRYPLMVGQAVSIPVNTASPEGSSAGKVLASPTGGVVPAIYQTGSGSRTQSPGDPAAVAPESVLGRQVSEYLAAIPSGDWVVYIEDLETGEVMSQFEKQVVHPASTIKIAVAAAFFHWFEDQENVMMSNGPVQGERSYEQLLKAMLIRSEEAATETLIDFLNTKSGYEVNPLMQSWGLADTTVLPRRTTASDMALLLKQLHAGSLLEPASTALLFDLLKTPSRGDDERIGGGLPEWVRPHLAHKPGTVFDDGWGVVGDVGILDTEDSRLLIVVIGNYVDWVDYDEAQAGIAGIAAAAYYEKMPDEVAKYVFSGSHGQQAGGSSFFDLLLAE